MIRPVSTLADDIRRWHEMKQVAVSTACDLLREIGALESNLDAGAEIEPGPLTYDRELRMVVPNPAWKDPKP